MSECQPDEKSVQSLGSGSAHRDRIAIAIKDTKSESSVREAPDQSSDNPEPTAPGSYNPLHAPFLIQINTQTHSCFHIYFHAVGLPTGYTAGAEPRHLIKRPGCHGAPGENGV
jgi:hypothetical protein